MSNSLMEEQRPGTPVKAIKSKHLYSLFFFGVFCGFCCLSLVEISFTSWKLKILQLEYS